MAYIPGPGQEVPLTSCVHFDGIRQSAPLNTQECKTASKQEHICLLPLPTVYSVAECPMLVRSCHSASRMMPFVGNMTNMSFSMATVDAVQVRQQGQGQKDWYTYGSCRGVR